MTMMIYLCPDYTFWAGRIIRRMNFTRSFLTTSMINDGVLPVVVGGLNAHFGLHSHGVEGVTERL